MAHKHKCPDPACGHVWKHDTIALRDDEDAYRAAHKCPECGTEQFWKHYESPADQAEDFIDTLIMQSMER